MDAKVKAAFWSDLELEDVEPEVRLALLWMFTNSMTKINGALELPGKRFAFETGLDVSWFERTLEAVPRMFVRAGKWVWIRKFIGHQIGRGEKLRKNNIGKSVAASVWGVPDEIRLAIWEEYPELKEMASPSKPLEGLQRASEGLPKGQSALSLDSSEALRSPSKPLEGVREEKEKEKSTEGDARGRESKISDLKSQKSAVVESSGEHEFVMQWGLAMEVLTFLGERTEQDFSRAGQNQLYEICLRLHEVNYDVAGVKKMVARQAALWGADKKMREFLRPQTLFESVKFHDYFAKRDWDEGAGLNPEERKKQLMEWIEKSPANLKSVYHNAQAAEAEKTQLKNWRRELEELNQK